MDLGTLSLSVAGAFVWLIFAAFLPRQATWFVLLWVPIQGWVQLNLFNDSNATVLIYEFQILGLYLVFVVRALKFPRLYGPPKVLWLAAPFLVWTCFLVPYSASQGGLLLTGVGLRTYLLPLPIVWLGYYAFRHRGELERVAAMLAVEMGITGIVVALQYARLVTSSGAVIDVPTGYNVVGVLRPPGTFSTPGHLGMYVLAMVPLQLGFLGFEVKWSQRVIYSLGLAGAMLSLVVNSQRATVVLLCACLPLLVVLAHKARAVKVVAISVGVAAAGVLLGLFVVEDAFGTRVRSISDDANYSLFVAPVERLALAMEKPVAGGGLGTASPGVARLDIATIESAESFMAALVFQLGVPGFLFFYLFLSALFVAGFRALQKCRRRDVGLLAAGILVYEISIFLQSWTYDPLHYPPSRVIFWFWAGVLLSLPHLADQPSQPERLQRLALAGQAAAFWRRRAGRPNAACLR